MKVIIDINDKLVTFGKMVCTKRNAIIGIVVMFFIGGIFIFSQAITKPHEFHTGDIVSAEEMNENFDALYEKVNELDSTIETLEINPWEKNGDDIYYNNGNIGIGTSTPDATLQVNGTVKMFGEWETRTLDLIYQAESDGFLMGHIERETNDVQAKLQGLTDNTSSVTSPNRIYMSASIYENASSNHRVRENSFMLPVRKGNYYRAHKAEYTGTCKVLLWWIPLGN